MYGLIEREDETTRMLNEMTQVMDRYRGLR